LFWDDGFAIFGFILVAVVGALWQYAARDMYYTLDVESGIEAFEADFFDRLHRWLMVSMIAELFFYTSLVSIKLSFLMFFRRLDTNVNYLKWLWWPTLFFTLATYFISVGNQKYKCEIGSTETIIGECNSPDSISFIYVTLRLNCAFDVLSDFLSMIHLPYVPCETKVLNIFANTMMRYLVMLEPFILLWNVRMRLARKLAFVGLFSLSLVTMIIATVRAADLNVTRRPDGQIDNTYLWLWSAIEASVGKQSYLINPTRLRRHLLSDL
jgi:hypothetical protein